MIPDRTQFRDGHRYLAAVASELARPVLRAYARRHAPEPPTEPRAWRRGVILGATHLGDVLYRTCSLEQLHAGLPECRWAYTTSRAGAELLAGNPALSEVIAVPGERDAVAARIATERFDVALCSDNIEHHAGLLTAVRAGIPNRVAFGSKGLTGLATLALPVPRASWPAQFQMMVRALTDTATAWPLRPRVYITASDQEAAESAWDALPMGDAPLTIAVAVTSRQRLGVFPPALFARILVRVLAMEPAARVVLTGSREDRAALDTLAPMIGSRAIVAAGVLPLRAYVAFLRRCSAFLGSDSGPRHMANAAGIPVFFVRNMAVPEIEAGRYCETEVDIAPPGQYLVPEANARALDAIDTDAVASALLRAAARRCPTPRLA